MAVLGLWGSWSQAVLPFMTSDAQTRLLHRDQLPDNVADADAVAVYGAAGASPVVRIALDVDLDAGMV